MTPSPTSISPERIIENIESSGLRGRGGAWFPAARKWRAVRAEGGEAVVVGNGAEGEPGSIKDRYVLRHRTLEVLEGLEIAAQALGAREALLYLKGSFAAESQALETALGDRPRATSVRVSRGEDGYIAGEETAVLEALEGRRGWPRPKPPLPYAVGYKGRPTLVQNVETLSLVGRAVRDPVGFRGAESTLVSLWGHVRRPGVYEVQLGTKILEIVDRFGEGAPEGVGMIFPGGPSSPPLDSGGLGLPLDPDALKSAGSALGTGSLLIIGKPLCPLSVAVSLAAFFERESCLQCPPCSVGTRSLARIVRQLEDGTARLADLRALEETAGFMTDHGYCAHGRTGATVIRGLLARFGASVEEHLQSRGCPGGKADPFAAHSAERTAIEAALEKAGPAA
jgi:NADH-quinone oxidoreductase subunit F